MSPDPTDPRPHGPHPLDQLREMGRTRTRIAHMATVDPRVPTGPHTDGAEPTAQQMVQIHLRAHALLVHWDVASILGLACASGVGAQRVLQAIEDLRIAVYSAPGVELLPLGTAPAGTAEMLYGSERARPE